MQARVMLAEENLFGPLIKAIAPLTYGPAGEQNIPRREHESGSAIGAKLTLTGRSRHRYSTVIA